MALRDTFRANAQHLLEPGETIQSVFGAQRTSGWFALLSIWIIVITSAYRVIVVTDRRIIVARSGRFRTTPVKGVLTEKPRNTLIGPAHGVWYKTDALGETLYINKRFHKDVAAADALVDPTAA
ncbi:MAG: hypothetical protein JWN67_2857 [Actinomycetia bacterium]|nr:hypothetical protein [Actinomycetes bacterium]